MTADDAEELLPANTAPGVEVKLAEEVLDDEAGVADVSPHLFHHIRLFARIRIKSYQGRTSSV